MEGWLDLPEPVEADQDLSPEDEVDLDEYELALADERREQGIPPIDADEDVDYTSPDNY